MEPEFYGVEGVTDEDRTYRGSRFAEVRDAIFANPYQKVWGAAGEPPLPQYKTTVAGALRGLLKFRRPQILQASRRTVDSHADLRWGPDRLGYRRLLHPNGVCLTGLWEITEDSGYSGHFKKGSKALIIGRYSTCCDATRRGEVRSLSLVGKIYPTTDPNHLESLRPASFFTQEDIGGDYARYVNDARLHNAPSVTPWRRGKGLLFLAIEGITFTLVDKRNSERQLHQIAELGKPQGEPTRTPRVMRLSIAQSQPRIEGDELDFRDEILGQIFDRGDPEPKRALVFDIDATDELTEFGALGFTRRRYTTWRRLGSVTFDNAVASYNGDHVIHFNHPGWRNDRNDPGAAVRRGL
ncbi:MAG: hypothetical protein FJX45_01605 [Alphaproteobacteria bacterium]|nr:hypothetical protein [Alphaproteobacteria bacterium]MBM3651413.1 hypothetical protein [Alphaproteobacteria bacterium]